MSTNGDAEASGVVLPDAPFVGLRPFERGEAAILVGRGRDAEMLRDKVFAARLTILYGPSGVGKSSIVRALLLPLLEKQGARTVYFDTWRGDDPLAMLKARLAEEASALRIANPTAGAPTAVELVRLIQSEDPSTIVLVLDQFEEFFTAHRDKIAAFRKEGGQLVRMPGVDVRVLLSLREEHLAALEALREEMLNLFQSTYRLEPLEQASVREAIVKPIELFGATIEDALIDKLVEDVATRATTAGAGASASVATADLPIMQLVCDELWKAGKAKQERPALTLPQYLDELGGKDGILQRYLRRVTPKRWRDKLVTAKLLKHLAPSDGYKVAFSVRDLAKLTDVKPARVKAEVERLSSDDVYILRDRAYGADKVLYELWHDSFIRIIAPWRDRLLNRARRLRRAGVVACVLASIGLAVIGYDQYELWTHTNVAMRSTHRTLEQKLDDVSEYLLLKRTGRARLEMLRAFLQQPSAIAPAGRRQQEAAEAVSLDRWPLVLEYSAQRHLDEFAFAQSWARHARALNERGLLVPLQLQLRRVDSHPRRHVTLVSRQGPLAAFDFPLEEHRAYVNADELKGPGLEFFEHFRAEWTPIAWASIGWWRGSWWSVPRWSLPAWKAAGAEAADGSGLLAFRLAHELQQRPEGLLTPAVVEILLERAAYYRDVTVEEARRVRGARITADLREIVRQGRTLVHLPQILDALAGMPDLDSAKAASAAVLGLDSARPDVAARLTGPPSRPAAPAKSRGNPVELRHEAYRGALRLLPDEPEIRLLVGSELAPAWLHDAETLRPETSARLQAVREELLRELGIVLPEAYPVQSRIAPAPKAFRIEFLDQDPREAAGGEPAQNELDAVASALAAGARAYRLHFISAEYVEDVLDAINPALRAWLTARYSITDLKLLLRAAADPGTSVEAGAPAVAPTVRHAAWLLGSLVFWAQIERGRELHPLGERLRDTQRARTMQMTIPDAVGAEVRDHVEAGRFVLLQGRLEAAQARFKDAIARDRAAAAAVFMASYQADVPGQLTGTLHARCEKFGWNNVFEPPRLRFAERAELEEFARSGELDRVAGVNAKGVPGPNARRLRLCLFAANADPAPRQLETALQISKGYGAPESWLEGEAAWFGHAILARFDPMRDDRQVKETGAQFLKLALPQFAEGAAADRLDRLGAICNAPGPTRWCWRLLVELAEHDGRPGALVRAAEFLIGRESPEDLEIAQKMARRAKVLLLAAAPPSANRRLLDRADYAIAAARLGLSRGSPAAPRDPIAQELSVLLTSPERGIDAHASLAELKSESGNALEAARITDLGLKVWQDSHVLLSIRLRLELAAGDRQAAARTAAAARKLFLRPAAGTSDEHAFVAALGMLMTEDGEWERVGREFLATKHRYVSYIAMILYARMSGAARDEAHELLKSRWARARPSSWTHRLKEGDETVWREMLLGHYIGADEARRYQLLEVLQDERLFAQSALRQLPLPRLAMLCELHFYEGLLAGANNDVSRMRENLLKTVATGYAAYYEHAMAKYLLAREK